MIHPTDGLGSPLSLVDVSTKLYSSIKRGHRLAASRSDVAHLRVNEIFTFMFHILSSRYGRFLLFQLLQWTPNKETSS